MDNKIINDDTYDYIIKNTIIESNRVLDMWNHNGKKYDSDDVNCMCKTYFLKFIKEKFGYNVIRRNKKIFNPNFYFKNNKIAFITLNKTTYFYEFADKLEKFDFESFNRKLEVDKLLTAETPKSITSLLDISFDDIKKIKF